MKKLDNLVTIIDHPHHANHIGYRLDARLISDGRYDTLELYTFYAGAKTPRHEKVFSVQLSDEERIKFIEVLTKKT